MTEEDVARIDIFAAMALNGMLAHSTRYKPRPGDPSHWHDAIAKEAYEIAHAMLRVSKTGVSPTIGDRWTTIINGNPVVYEWSNTGWVQI